VGAEERPAVLNAAIDVTLGREVDDVGDAVPHRGPDGLPVGDVAADELVPRVALDVLEVGEVAGVGQGVEVDDRHAGVGGEEVADEVRPDEPAPAGHEQRRHTHPTGKRWGWCTVTATGRQTGSASITLFGDLVGTTRASRQPA